MRDRDGSAACALLAPETRSELEQAEHKPCAQAILDSASDPQQVQSVQQWGNAAIASFESDTVFLARFDDGWKVTAAACRPRPERPYDCRLQGG